MGSSGPGRVRVECGIYRQPNGKYAVCWRHAGRLHLRTTRFGLAEARHERLALIAATREGKVPVSPRLASRRSPAGGLSASRRATPYGHRNVSRHCLRPAAQLAGTQQRRLAAASFPRPAPHLRQPPDHRPRARPSPGQPHARPRAHLNHARDLHTPVRGRPPHARHPRPHGRQPIRRSARVHENVARRDGAQAPMTAAFVQEQARVKTHTERLVLVRGGVTERTGGLSRSRDGQKPLARQAAALASTCLSYRDGQAPGGARPAAR
jgi:hypothetical protein